MTDIRVTQAAIETLTSASFSPTARVSQMSLEVVASFTDFSPVARVTRMMLEVLTSEAQEGGEPAALRRVTFSINYT